MAAILREEIERIGTSPATPPDPSSNPSARKKPRWPAAKKVLWGSNRSRYQSSAKLNVKVPDYCPDHVPLHKSFGDELSLAPLLAEVEAKDAQLQALLDSAVVNLASERADLQERESGDEEEERDTFEESLVRRKLPPEELQCFQDFVCSFLSMFLQSKFLRSRHGIGSEHDPTELVLSLASNRSCPNATLFRRVAIDPKLLASAVLDSDNVNPGYAESGVAVNQLARLLDVAVLQFLSTVNEHTDVHTLLWALNYMKNLLGSLISSMNSLNSFGWYGAPHIRIRKGTAVGSRKSSTAYLLQPPFGIPPPLVVVGTPPVTPHRSPERVVLPPPHQERVEEQRDPVTGQEISPALSPAANRSPLFLHRNTREGSREGSPTSLPFPSGPGTAGRSASGTELGARAASVSAVEGRQRRISRQEQRGILKAPSLELALPSSPYSPKLAPHSPSPSLSSPVSPRFQHPVAAERKRKVTPVPMMPRPPTAASMGSILEEDDDGKDEACDANLQLALGTSRTGSMCSIPEVREEEDERLFSMDSVEKGYFQSMQDEVGPPVPRPPGHTSPMTSPLEVAVKSHDTRLGTPPSSGASRSVSPMAMGSPPEFSRSPSPTPVANSRGRGIRSASMSPPPPPPNNTPAVDVDLELKTLLNGEGRISLLALLHAIANFPQCDEIWTAEVGELCFSLIQLCMDIGMPPRTDDASPKPASTGTERRKRFCKQDNKAFNQLSAEPAEKPWKVHSRFVIKFSVEALVQCGTCSIVGCTMDSTFCRLKQFHVTAPHGTAAHNRLTRNLRRIHLHSPTVFRQALIEFSRPSKSSCRRLFQFLHVVLQYCMHGGGDVGFNHLLASVVMSVMSTTVDRLVQLDITEPSIQDVIVKEACNFINYSNQLFFNDTVAKTRSFQHLHMYLHRIALSVILPPRPPPEQERPLSPLQAVLKEGIGQHPVRVLRGGRRVGLSATDSPVSSPKPATSATAPRGSLIKQKSLGATGGSSPMAIRGRSSSFHSVSSSAPVAESSKPGRGKGKSPLLKQETVAEFGGSHRKNLFTKDDSVLSDMSAAKLDEPAGKEKREVSEAERWRGLSLETLRRRIQKLVILMHLSEPGTIPNASILASLVDLCDGTTVVARSMVFLECAMFVRSLCSQSTNPPCTVWVQHNLDNPRMHAVTSNLRKWAEAIGEKLRLVELKEKEMHLRLSSKLGPNDPLILPREPVFPDENSHKADGSEGGTPDVGFCISYSLKMVACNLLLEITRFLRDIPPHFSPAAPTPLFGTPQMSQRHSLDRTADRKVSNASMASSDDSAFHQTHTRAFSTEFRMPQGLGNFGSSLSVEDAPEPVPDFTNQFSVDEISMTGSSLHKKRASFYLHINTSNSAGGTLSRSLSRNTSFKKPPSRVVRMAETPTEVRTLSRPSYNSSSPSSRARRKSVSAGVPQLRRPSILIANNASFLTASQPNQGFHPTKRRRKSVGAVLSHRSLQEADYTVPTTPSTPHTPGGSFFAGSGGGGGGRTGSGATSFGNSLNVGITKLKRAFRRHGTKTKAPAEVSPSTSPGPLQRKKSTRRQSSTDAFPPKSPFHSSLTEESWRYYPWLDMVEHLILVDTKEASVRNKEDCEKLVVALKRVYSRTYREEEEEERVGRGGGKGKKDSTWNGGRKSSLGTLFIHRLALNDSFFPVEDKAGSTFGRGQSLPSGRHEKHSVQTPRSISLQYAAQGGFQKNRQGSLGRLTFANWNSSSMYVANYLASGGAGIQHEETIQLAIESESPFEKAYITAQSDKERTKYVKSELSGLVHIPFSTLIYAAPILHSRTFSILKGVAWDALLGLDEGLSQAAAAFFLLACAKEPEKAIKGFVTTKVINRGALEQRWAILRFKVLWDCRYGVWPRMQERAQKQLNLNDKEDKKEGEHTIGYSLLANLLGHPGTELPLSPCDPISVCTSKTCGNNPDKCYRPTKTAPVVHATEISEKVHGYSVSGVSVTQETGVQSDNVVYRGFESEDAAGPREWEAVDCTLFPRSLLPLIKFLLMSLVPSPPPSTPTNAPSTSDPSTSGPSEDPHLHLDKSELARQVVWTCMVEDPRLFFRPLFNRFSRLYMAVSDQKSKRSHVEYLMASCLEPFHVVLQAFPNIPARAAHILLNNFVGVVLQHTDQPYTLSGKVIQSILTLITMVAPSVQGLDSKLMKSFLKKESCYTTIMSTARIRGVDRVYLMADYEPKLYKVTDDMTFGHLIAEACQTDQLTLDLLNNCYLVDRNKDLPLLSSLVVRDHYSASSDNQHPTFVLQKAAGTSKNVWGHQMDQLFTHKMSELVRVLFAVRLLATGPEVERGFAYSEFALPNHQFIHNELVELNSFPRKALTSIFYEAGPSALQHFQLRSSDIMLKGMWVRFVLELVTSVRADYDWSNTLLLFMNVVNGALLLHGEDQTILYYSLVTMLTTVTKFNPIFVKDGYQMIIPTLVQVYSFHMRNRFVTKAIEFVWMKFYLLNKNVFFLQVMAAGSTLLSEEAASLTNSVNSKLAAESRRNAHMEAEEAKRLYAKALIELNSTLTIEGREALDELNLLHCCYYYLDPDLYRLLTSNDTRQRLSIKDAAVLCATLARWNPEAVRGMQVLVFLDCTMPHLLPLLGMEGLKFMTDTIQFLVKGCESISKVQRTHKKDPVARKGGANQDKEGEEEGQLNKPSIEDDDSAQPKATSRKTSVAKVVGKILFNPNRKDVQGGAANLVKETEPPAPPTASKAASSNQFRFYRGHGHDHRVLQLSADSLLSIAAEVCLFYSRRGVAGSVTTARKFSWQPHHPRKISVPAPCSPLSLGETTAKVSLDPPSVTVLVTIATHMLSTYSEDILQGKGLNVFFAHLIPNLDWTEGHMSSFSTLLQKMSKLFRHLQKHSNKAILVFDNLTNFITGITACIHNNPHLVQGQEQNLAKLRTILEGIMVMQSGRGDPQTATFHKRYSRSVVHRPLLENAPTPFAEAVIGLAAELIALTNCVPDRTLGKLRYHISDLVTLKSLKDFEGFLMPKIVLPLCIQLGLRPDVKHMAEEDIDFIMKFVENKVELFFKFSNQKLLPEQIFRVIRVISCAFSETLTLHHWNRIAQWIHSLFTKKLTFNRPQSAKSVSGSSISASRMKDSGQGRPRGTRLSSVSGGNASPLESFISFHDNLLSFFEQFLVVHRVPLFPLLFPLLWKLEPALQLAKQGVKVDNPAQLEKVSNCIERCLQLQKSGPRVCSMKPREELLREILDDLKWHSQISGRSTLTRSHTTVDGKRSKKKPRRTSMVLTNISEDRELESSLSFSSTMPRDAAISINGEGRKAGMLMRSVSASAASHSANITPPSRRGVAAKPGLPTIAASPQRTNRRRPLSYEDQSRPPSLLRKSRLPKRTETPGSIDYAADDEEASDAHCPLPSGNLADQQPRRLKVPAHTPEEPSSLVISNQAKTSSPFQTKKKAVSFEQSLPQPNSEVVSAEVHYNSEATSQEESQDCPSLSPSHDHLGVYATDLETSTTSETLLLPRARSPNHSPQTYHLPKRGSPELQRKRASRGTGREDCLLPTGGSLEPRRKHPSPGADSPKYQEKRPIFGVNRLSVAELEESDTSLLPYEKTSPKGSPRRRRHQSLVMDRLGAAELEASVTSETHLLPEGSPEQTQRRSKSPSFPSRKKSLSQPNVRGDDRDRLLNLPGEGAPYVAWEEDGGHGGMTRNAYSLDHKMAERTGVTHKDKKGFYNVTESDEG